MVLNFDTFVNIIFQKRTKGQGSMSQRKGSPLNTLVKEQIGRSLQGVNIHVNGDLFM